jgi:hypothetical protein
MPCPARTRFVMNQNPDPHPQPWSLAFLKKASKKPPPPGPRPQNRGGGKSNLRFFCPFGQKNRLKKAPPPWVGGRGVGAWAPCPLSALEGGRDG